MILPDLSSFEKDAAAGPVLAEIQRARWRKARDAAKELCRKDKIRYLPLLVAANAGLAQDLWSRGLAHDAEGVVEYLKTIASAELMAALQARQAESQAAVAVQKAVGSNTGEAAAWSLAEAAAAALDAGTEPTPAALRAIDALVTAAWPVPEGSSAFVVELRAVRTAVQATGDGSWEAAREALRTLPRHSVFQHWRFFLRGVRHAHLGEKADAQLCFDPLPAGSAPARAAALYRDLLGLPPAADSSPTDAGIVMLTALAGVPAGWATPIVEASRHWKRGKLDKAYEALAQPLRQHFPSDEPGLGAILTDVVFAGSAGKSSLPYDAQQDLVSLFLERYHGEKFRSDRERLFALRFFLHEDAEDLEAGIAEEYGSDLAKTWARVARPDRLRESALWTMIAGHVQPVDDATGLLSTPKPSDLPSLRRMWQRATALDPENPDPAVRLAQFHLSAGDQSAYNDMLTDLVKRFPEAKAVLILSAQESVRRKSWPKALKTLRQVRAADPADSTVNHLMLSAIMHQALAFVQKSQPVPLTLWEELEPCLLDLPPASRPTAGFPFARSRWAAYITQSLLGHPTRQQQAEALAPSPWVHFYMTHLIMQRSGFAQVLLLPQAAPSWGDLLWFAHLNVWDAASRQPNKADHNVLLKVFRDWLRQLKSNDGLAKNQGGLLSAVNVFQQNSGASGPTRLWVDFCGELSRFLGPAARKKNSPYQLRMASLILLDRLTTMEIMAADMERLLQEATVAGDGPTIAIINHYLDIARRHCPAPAPATWEGEPPPHHQESYGKTSEDREELLSDEMLPSIQILAAVLKLNPKADLSQLQSTMSDVGMNEHLWKIVLQSAKKMAARMTRRQAETIVATEPGEVALPPPTRPQPRANPFQPELF
jgi:hypothetical protein